MIYSRLAYAVVFTASSVLGNPSPANNKANNNAGSSSGACLATDAIQSGSTSTGIGSIGSDAGQAASATDPANFINFCSGKTLTNGLQQVQGSCNGIVMGDIPAKTSMVSSVITFPETGSTIASDTTFTIKVQVSNLVAGSFTAADTTYYAAPQALSGGKVVGHTHVTVQDMGKSLNPTVPLDPTQFAFFKGINDAGDGKGGLSANVTGGLPAGIYRVCTMASASNHQAVIMPVAQRGAQDDCTKFTVSGNGKTVNVAANNGSKGEAAASNVQAAANAFQSGGVAAEETADSAASASTAAATSQGTSGGKNGGGKNGGGKNGGGKNGGSKNAVGNGSSGTAVTAAPATATTAAAAAAPPASDNTATKSASGGKNGGGRKHRGGKTTGAANVSATAAATVSSAAENKPTGTASTGNSGNGGKNGKGGKNSENGKQSGSQRLARRQFIA